MTELDGDGWTVRPWCAATAAWSDAARAVAQHVVNDPVQRRRWLRHGGTWFAGVDALPNAKDGSVDGVPLAGDWTSLVEMPVEWHRAQLSVVFPGYPARDPDESEASHRFRRDRDAAHLDGLIAEGPARRRHLREPHAFILGLPLTAMRADWAPFVIWRGSHHVIARAFGAVLSDVPSDRWGDVDLTDVYQAARREVFATCPRVEVTATPGEAILCHRMAIHGTAPWATPAGRGGDAGECRMVAWFRPTLPRIAEWLSF
jgi:hypothetical protein